ncbi:transcription factor Sp6 [Protopterus annectens]|uniref:transcription factor Sp6 n=1 Tax=Protopterus annectens TaxID=7888 RepID=UPI001CFC3FF0|nr:transcription factor Sp6 [Protopterus annectens]
MAHPYESWFLPPSHSSSVAADGSVASWWDLHNGTSWMDVQNNQGGHQTPTLPGVTSSTVNSYTAEHQMCGSSSHMFSSTQHFLGQEGLKQVDPVQESHFLDQTVEETTRPKGSKRSMPRNAGQAVCHCPNCLEAERNGSCTDSTKKNLHNCHIAGCGKAYAKTSHLKAHLRWHSGDRPFVCNWLFCGKRFSRSDELQRHLQTHTGTKKFTCTICNRIFMRHDHLHKHKKTHSEAREKNEMESNTGQDDPIQNEKINLDGNVSSHIL